MNRRGFSKLVASTVAFGPALLRANGTKRRVAIIGHTGRGDYGHGLDTAWLRLPEFEIVGVADADKRGLARELDKLEVERGYMDYREMLAEVKPEFVAVCPRFPDRHKEMIIASIKAGARGIYVEKPYCRSPAEVDEIENASRGTQVQIAVAHRNRYHPVMPLIAKFIEDGGLGRVLEIRGRGKGDRRGGDEDLWVLGSHVLDLCNYFSGTPISCSAVMLRDGRPVTKQDIRDGAEGLGPLAANEVHACYVMSSGTVAYFDSVANDGTENQGFGLRIIGSKGVIQIQADRDPVAHLIPGNPFKPVADARPWTPITTAGFGRVENQQHLLKDVYDHTVAIRDLLSAVDANREPKCGAAEGAMTVEMICAVFESHRLSGQSVPIPLKERTNALTRL